MTGFTPKVRSLILERDGGCALSDDRCDQGIQVHHRAGRQMGGSKNAWINRPPNGVALCPHHHRWVGEHPRDAEHLGYIVRRGVHKPADIPIDHHRLGVVFLTDDGGYTHEPPE